MKKTKLNGFQKLVCFALASILCVALLCFAASGLQNENPKLPNVSGNVSDTTDKTDDNKDEETPTDDSTVQPPNENQNPEQEKLPSIQEQIEYINAITGLKISAGEYNSTPIGAVIDPKSTLYGISASDMVIEFPTEKEHTRLLAYTSSKNALLKVGALMPTRDFITDMAMFFGGIIVSNGKDDVVEYKSLDSDAFLIDLTIYNDCFYLENGVYSYTSNYLIEKAKENKALASAIIPYNTAPYEFLDDDAFYGISAAAMVTIPYSYSKTELYYNEKIGEYVYYKCENKKTDMLTGKNLSYKNVFVLFADTTTHEKSNGTELVVDVLSGGKGFYISDGKYCEFRWQTDKTGNISFTALDGNPLKVNRGSCYIAYYKSTSVEDIIIK